MTDFYTLLSRLEPKQDGESPVRHRTGVVDAVNSDGTVDLVISGETVSDVAVLAGVSAPLGETVQVAAWRGDLLVLGAIRPSGGGGITLLAEAIADGSSQFLSVGMLPQTHLDLRIVLHGDHEGAATLNVLQLRFNVDATEAYRWTRIQADDDGNPVRASDQSDTEIQPGHIGSSTFGSMVTAYVPNYAANTPHSITWESGATAGAVAGSSRIHRGWGFYSVSAPITAVQLIVATDDWEAGSTLRVYGIG